MLSKLQDRCEKCQYMVKLKSPAQINYKRVLTGAPNVSGFCHLLLSQPCKVNSNLCSYAVCTRNAFDVGKCNIYVKRTVWPLFFAFRFTLHLELNRVNHCGLCVLLLCRVGDVGADVFFCEFRCLLFVLQYSSCWS